MHTDRAGKSSANRIIDARKSNGRIRQTDQAIDRQIPDARQLAVAIEKPDFERVRVLAVTVALLNGISEAEKVARLAIGWASDPFGS